MYHGLVRRDAVAAGSGDLPTCRRRKLRHLFVSAVKKCWAGAVAISAKEAARCGWVRLASAVSGENFNYGTFK